MLADNLILVFAIGGALAVLTILQFVLATSHDKARSASPRFESLEGLDARISQKKDTIADIDKELRDRREAMANFAAVQADVDELERRYAELKQEWSSLDEKREEVRKVRLELEQLKEERHSAEAGLASSREELEVVGRRLERAERLVGQIESLNAEHGELQEKIKGMRDQLHDLEEAESRIVSIENRASELESRNSRLEGQILAHEAEFQEIRARVLREREVLAEAQTERNRAVSEVDAVKIELRKSQEDIGAMSDRRTTLEARLAQLKTEIDERTGSEKDRPEAEEVYLTELKTEPPVLRNLAVWEEATPEDEADALQRVSKHLEDSGLDYPVRVVRAFHTAMKVNETTQMTVLGGISGTGKSQLPRQYAAGMGIGFLQVPVQPRWDSPQDLMGFYNYIEGRFRPTDLARALWALDEQNNPSSKFTDRMMLVLLDEMNLARVEYYFSDFLSRLESRPRVEAVSDGALRKDAEIELEIPMPKGKDAPRIFPGYNLLFAGTMNEDESTQSLSDKVVDRANVLRFAAPKKIKSGTPIERTSSPEALSRKRWSKWVRPVSDVEGENGVRENIRRMVSLMKDFRRPFGHRLGRAIMAYVANYPILEGSDRTNEALADQVEMRLLPKLRGVEIDTADAAFSELRSFVDSDLRDAVLADAIGESVRNSESTGQFVWTGVTR